MAQVTKQQLWVGVVLAGLLFLFLVYGVFSGISDRAIIKERIDQLLSNLSQIDSQQNNLLYEIKTGQNQSEVQRQEQLSFILPALERSFNQTDIIVNSTNETKALTSFLSENFGVDSDYLERENFQYGQANQTFEWLNQSLQNQEKIMSMLNNSRR
jgi:hypothetical protein